MTIREHYSHARADGHKQKKRTAAEVRAQARTKRGDAGQITKLNRQGHTAAKERKRLTKGAK